MATPVVGERTLNRNSECEGKERRDWEEAFRATGSSAEDELLLEGVGANEFDRKEWKW